MRWLIVGAGGQLGQDLVTTLSGQDVTGLTRTGLDLRDEAAVHRVVGRWLDGGAAPAVVVNAAAYTAVDAAETDEAAATVVNGLAPGWLAAAAGDRARLIHVSTDYVFSGSADRPYEVEDPPDPATAYGRSKLLGERAALAAGTGVQVVRTGWVYSRHGTNFVQTMIGLERSRPTIDVVDDQTGSPTWSAHLAQALVGMGLSVAPAGIYHCTGGGSTTWCGLARAVFSELGADPARVHAVGTDAVPRPARRPAYSVLSDAAWRAAGLAPMPAWRGALRTALRGAL